MMRMFTAITAAGLAGAVATGATAAGDSADRAALDQEQKQPFGTYLTDSSGRSLYMFEADREGGASTCYEGCAEAWPPLLTSDEPRAIGGAVDESKIGTVERRGGAQQVTYGGWPLYYFVKDSAPGDTEGQDVKGFGAEWYLISPEGEVIEATAGQGDSQQQAASASDSASQPAEVSIDGERLSAGELIGREVVTQAGDRIGEVAQLINRDNAPNDVIVEVDAENRQMGIVVDDPELLPGKATDEPVVLGGKSIALPAEELSMARNGQAVVIDSGSLRTVGELQSN